MRILFFGGILGLLALVGLAAAQTEGKKAMAAIPAPFKVFVAVPEGNVVNLGRGTLQVVIQNISDKPQPIYTENNSWGYGVVSLAWEGPEGKKGMMVKKEREWRKNVLTTTTLEPGQMLVRTIPLSAEPWQNGPTVARPAEEFTFVAVYSVAQPHRGRPEGGVWMGEVKSEPVKVRVYGE